PVHVHAHPFSAIIHTKKEECDFYGRCSGVIISRNYVLTAQHCLEYSSVYLKECGLVEEDNGEIDERTETFVPKDIIVYVGSSSIAEAKKKGDGFKVKKIKRYSASYVSGQHTFIDLALLELQENLTFTASIRPICVANDYVVERGERAFFTGYGQTTEPKSRPPAVGDKMLSSNNLNEVHINLASKKIL
ncbi:Serine proteinase, partial [Meloidogyne graminicola]